jgi:potassium-transporting ATPase KdpC subunit
MKRNIITAILMTVVTTILVGLVYPMVVTLLAQVLFHDKANGQLIVQGGKTIGSRIIAQPFTGAGYFHPRGSAAGTNGYDAANSGGTNYGPTNQKLVDRVKTDVAAAQSENPSKPVPADYVTTSASGLDPDITPANAEFQAPRVAKERGISDVQLMDLVHQNTQERQFHFLGEARVNVLELNLELDSKYPLQKRSSR